MKITKFTETKTPDQSKKHVFLLLKHGTSSAELLATFCDDILKKGGSEKLSHEAIEETLEKVSFTPDELFTVTSNRHICNFLASCLQVVKLLAYIRDKDLFAEFYRYIVVLFSADWLVALGTKYFCTPSFGANFWFMGF